MLGGIQATVLLLLRDADHAEELHAWVDRMGGGG
jgi:hypothetical protein